MPAGPHVAASVAAGRIRLRHLQCFLAVARHGTLRAAADALSVTQPAVTKTLNELESLLGAKLFVRGRHGAAPTPQAERFLPHAVASVGALAQAIDSVGRGAAAGLLRLGVLPTVAPFVARVLGAAAGGLLAAAAVRVSSGSNRSLIDRLRASELDAVIGRLSDPEAMVGLSFEHLYGEPMLIAVRPGHPLLADPAAQPSSDELAAWPMVLPLAGTLIRQLVDGFLAGRGVPARHGVIETLDTALPRALLLDGGDHLWFTPAGVVLADLQRGMLARLPVEITPAEAIGLIRRADSAASGALPAFIEAVRAEAARRREAGALP